MLLAVVLSNIERGPNNVVVRVVLSLLLTIVDGNKRGFSCGSISSSEIDNSMDKSEGVSDGGMVNG